ncbi:MAG: 3-phosphoshikimate 1-carboxyvinyltransferase [Anaerolineaceae bacterium]|nr:3-phosphoshikimate 1-carboxyvinyltransferase [Anaerolineaceae bacterium]
MKLIVTPGRALQGAIGENSAFRLPGDKSLSHRAALLSAMAQGDSMIDHFLVSGVTLPLLNALNMLGVDWQLDGTTLIVHGHGLQNWHAPQGPVYCGNSATTLRLLAGALAASGIAATLDGSSGLRRRPMGRIVEPLQQMGVQVEAFAENTAPLIFSARPSEQRLRPIQYTLPVASAQVKSCLLLAALAAGGPTLLSEPGPSRDHTERMLKSMGVGIRFPNDESTQAPLTGRTGLSDYSVQITPPSPLVLHPLQLSIPGDLSSAAFLIVAGIITPGSEITLEDVGLNPGRTGLLDALKGMGASIEINNLIERSGEPVGDITVRSSLLKAIKVSGPLVVRMIDEFPAFAIAAAFAEGDTLVCDAQELRTKESDRISALCQELNAVGVQAVEMPDGFSIHGGKLPTGGTINPHGDHRLAMSLAVAGLAARHAVEVAGAEIMDESFPGFVEILQQLGGDLQVEPETAG